MSNSLLAKISRDFFETHGIHSYRMKKVREMDEAAVIRYCHWYCEENNLTDEFNKRREQTQAEYVYCEYMREYIQYGCCYDMQMIGGGYISQSALPDIPIDREKLEKCCADCKNRL